MNPYLYKNGFLGLFLALVCLNCGGGSATSTDSASGSGAILTSSGSTGLGPFVVGAPDSADWTGWLTAQASSLVEQQSENSGLLHFQTTLFRVQEHLWKRRSFNRAGGARCTLDALKLADLERYLGVRPHTRFLKVDEGEAYLPELIENLKLALDYKPSSGAYNTDSALDFLTQLQARFIRLSESAHETSGMRVNQWSFNLPEFTQTQLQQNASPQDPYSSPWILSFYPLVYEDFTAPQGPTNSNGGTSRLGGGGSNSTIRAYVLVTACSPI